jgi:hypothetical protein
MDRSLVLSVFFAGSVAVAILGVVRTARGNRRFAALVYAPGVVGMGSGLAVASATLVTTGWLGLLLVAPLYLVFILFVRQMLRTWNAGKTASSDEAWEGRLTAIASEPQLVLIGLMLIGGVVAVVGLIVYGVIQAANRPG